MSVGFTGTRDGMTHEQMVAVRGLLSDLLDEHVDFHHGDCIGSDAQAHAIATNLGYQTVAYPGHDRHGETPTRANCAADVIHEPEPYLVRDRKIAAQDVLIGTPNNFRPRPRGSGTWTTLRYGREAGTDRFIVYPDGQIQMERGE